METFYNKLRTVWTDVAEKLQPAEVVGPARDGAIKSYVEQKLKAVQSHVRVTTNTQYAAITWDANYEKTDEVDTAWIATSVL